MSRYWRKCLPMTREKIIFLAGLTDIIIVYFKKYSAGQVFLMTHIALEKYRSNPDYTVWGIISHRFRHVKIQIVRILFIGHEGMDSDIIAAKNVQRMTQQLMLKCARQIESILEWIIPGSQRLCLKRFNRKIWRILEWDGLDNLKNVERSLERPIWTE